VLLRDGARDLFDRRRDPGVHFPDRRGDRFNEAIDLGDCPRLENRR
jgi:hypothetical protein